MQLARFNQLDPTAARAAIAHCVAIARWQKDLIADRPYASLAALLTRAEALTRTWQEADLHEALAAHPRIGERASGSGREAQLSLGEQSAMTQADDALHQAMRQKNACYEARFGYLFLIRARGRSAQAMLAALDRRLQQSPEQELVETLGQLREITLLRLRESVQ